MDEDLLRQMNCTSGLVIATALNFSMAAAGQRIATIKERAFCRIEIRFRWLDEYFAGTRANTPGPASPNMSNNGQRYEDEKLFIISGSLGSSSSKCCVWNIVLNTILSK